MSADTNGGPPTIAVVLPGGGARGAYEAGALAELLPALEARGERVSIFCGTSVGAINAAQLASVADRPAAEATDATVKRWTDMRKGDVIRRDGRPGPAADRRPLHRRDARAARVQRRGAAQPVAAARVASTAGSTGTGCTPTRARAACARRASWRRRSRTGGPVAFVESAGTLPANPPNSDLRYLGVELAGEHVRASAAIPLLFPPVEVGGPEGIAGHYIDGGTRLNTPIQPALALGAQRVIVIGFEPFAGGAPRNGNGHKPQARRHRRERDRRPARRPGRRRPAAARVDQLVLRRGRERRPLPRRARLPPQPRPGALPEDLLRAGRPARARRHRARSPRASSSAATPACAGCARPTTRCSRGWPAAARSRAASCCRSCSSTPSSRAS